MSWTIEVRPRAGEAVGGHSCGPYCESPWAQESAKALISWSLESGSPPPNAYPSMPDVDPAFCALGDLSGMHARAPHLRYPGCKLPILKGSAQPHSFNMPSSLGWGPSSRSQESWKSWGPQNGTLGGCPLVLWPPRRLFGPHHDP